MRNCIKIAGVTVDRRSLEEVVDACCDAILTNKIIRIAMINARKIKLAHQHDEILGILNTATISGADGVSLIAASKLLRTPLRTGRVNGTDLMMELLSASDDNGFRVFLFGATQEVLEGCVQVISEQFSGTVICGVRNGYDLSNDYSAEIEQIIQARAQIVFIALPSPAKERVGKMLEDRCGANVIHGVGGSFDVLCGNISRAPVAWQRSGMEWLHRLMKEPVKMAPRVFNENLYLLKVVALQLLGLGKK